MDRNQVLQVLLFVLTVLTFGGALAVNYLIGKGGGYMGLNFTSIGNVSRMYETAITPSGWAFAIWGIIYLWQMALLIYTGTLFCRNTSKKSYEINVTIFNLTWFYLAHICSSLSNAIWVVIWCLEYVQYATIPIAMTPISLWFAVGVITYGLQMSIEKCTCKRNMVDIILTVILVQNGIGIYATWTSIATLINIVVALTYFANISMTTVSTVALSVLTCKLSVWFLLDNFKFEKACRYFFMPYVVVIYAVSAIIDHTWVPGSTVSIFSAVLLGISVVFLLAKISVVIVRSLKYPLFTNLTLPNQHYEKEKLVFGQHHK